jgi:hypothetical protein
VDVLSSTQFETEEDQMMSSLNSFKTGDTVSVRGLLFNTVGCLVPLSPYILTSQVHSAFLLSIEVTLVALFIFGFVKARFTGAPTHWRSRRWCRLPHGAMDSLKGKGIDVRRLKKAKMREVNFGIL